MISLSIRYYNLSVVCARTNAVATRAGSAEEGRYVSMGGSGPSVGCAEGAPSVCTAGGGRPVLAVVDHTCAFTVEQKADAKTAEDHRFVLITGTEATAKYVVARRYLCITDSGTVA